MTQYTCTKCHNSDFETNKVSMTGDFWSRFFDISHQRYTAVSCKSCGHTEFYKGSSTLLSNILDFIGHG